MGENRGGTPRSSTSDLNNPKNQDKMPSRRQRQARNQARQQARQEEQAKEHRESSQDEPTAARNAQDQAEIFCGAALEQDNEDPLIKLKESVAESTAILVDLRLRRAGAAPMESTERTQVKKIVPERNEQLAAVIFNERTRPPWSRR